MPNPSARWNFYPFELDVYLEDFTLESDTTFIYQRHRGDQIQGRYEIIAKNCTRPNCTVTLSNFPISFNFEWTANISGILIIYFYKFIFFCSCL